ncbi:Sphingomyelin phosphodiesterase 2, neutral membrane (Neutral sphingomyelinase) [Gaertneriomyces sp. JEL0708]|nr:Sphingomyelin phosphodiesterase 2, neutral membrane (Neutral sphingomyelinase) [Gaertneriomyces sp. JEL0708]
MFLRPPGIHSHAGDHKNARLDHIIQHLLPNYDIVAFQECFAFATSRRKYLIERAKEAGFTYSYGSPLGGWLKLRIDGGLLILSRLPILETRNVVFPRGKHSDWLAAKGIIYCKVSLSDSTHLHLFTTHLQASYGFAPISSPTAQIRLSQLRQGFHFLNETLKELKQSDNDLILFAGDFNVNGRTDDGNGNSHSEEYTAMVKLLSTGDLQQEKSLYKVRDLLYETYREHPVTSGTLHKGTVESSKSAIDYIFALEKDGASGIYDVQNVKVEELPVDGQPWTNVSDHSGISCVICPKNES